MRRLLTASGFPNGVVQPGMRLRRLDDADPKRTPAGK
jgi:hypothetical protein